MMYSLKEGHAWVFKKYDANEQMMSTDTICSKKCCFGQIKEICDCVECAGGYFEEINISGMPLEEEEE